MEKFTVEEINLMCVFGSVKFLPFFIKKYFILGSLQIKRALTSLFWYNVLDQNSKIPTYQRSNAHEHYTLFTTNNSRPLSTKLFSDLVYL